MNLGEAIDKVRNQFAKSWLLLHKKTALKK